MSNNLRNRLARLEAAKAIKGGGVVVELREGGFLHLGRVYKAMADLPRPRLGCGFLVVPGPIPSEHWEAMARGQQNL